jgi:hypothetical protein
MGIDMVSAARLLVLGLVAWGALLLTSGVSVVPASAQDECKADVVTAAGKGGRFGIRAETRAKELEGKGKAMNDAILAWEQDVGGRFGDDWGQWDRATDKSFRCEPVERLVGGIVKVGCTISGRPCLAPGGAAASDDGRRRRADRYDDDTGGSPAYRLMMRYQRELAEARQRREEWGWKWENNRQSWLKDYRRRAELRQVRWEILRSRYYGWYAGWWGSGGYSDWGRGRWHDSWDYSRWNGGWDHGHWGRGWDYDRWDSRWDYSGWTPRWVQRAWYPDLPTSRTHY